VTSDAVPDDAKLMIGTIRGNTIELIIESETFAEAPGGYSAFGSNNRIHRDAEGNCRRMRALLWTMLALWLFRAASDLFYLATVEYPRCVRWSAVRMLSVSFWHSVLPPGAPGAAIRREVEFLWSSPRYSGRRTSGAWAYARLYDYLRQKRTKEDGTVNYGSP